MSIEVQQSSPNSFLITLYSGWSWHDVQQAHEEISRLSNGERPVHTFVEIDGPISMPMDIDSNARPWLELHAQQHGGMLVFITQWGVVKSLLKLIALSGPLNYVKFANSIEEAHELIHQWEVS